MNSEQAIAVDQSMIAGEENVRVQCSNSSDFVVGKQTNFNGPVTIINCPLPPTQDVENVVIRDRIWTDATLKAVESKAKDVPMEKGTEPISNKPAGPSLSNKQGTYSSLPIIKDLIAVKFLGLPLLFWLILSMVVTAIIIATIVSLTAKVESDSVSKFEDRQFIGNESHLFFTKQQWKGLKASSFIPIIEPVPYVVISHTAGPFCYEPTSCQEVVRHMQKDHMSRTPPFADVVYNFMVGGDGYIYEGRGWGVRSPHLGFIGNRNIDINFIGDFSVYDVPTPTQVDAVLQLIERGIQDCHISKDYILVAHNQTTPTLSPGRNVYSIISQWPHFRIDPPKNITSPQFAGLDSSCKPTMAPYSKSQKNV